MAHSPRGWTGARSPQALKRVRQAARRRAINQPRRSAAKTLVGKAVSLATTGAAAETREALLAAVSALDRAAKVGAIHPNQAARRKSRLMRKVNAALGGEATQPATGKAARTTGKAAATKAAKARVAASKAVKAKGEQTAAGKARAALTRSTRGETPAPTPEETPAAETRTTRSTTARATTARRSAATEGGTASRGGTTGATRTGGGTSRAAGGTSRAGGSSRTRKTDSGDSS